MDISNKKCVPCEGAVTALSQDKLEKYLATASGWKLSGDGREIEKLLKFKNFSSALTFVNKVGIIAESENHHPDIEFGWGYCKIRLSTHSIGGLHENDFIVAAKINEIGNV